jgi:hypothetical protein
MNIFEIITEDTERNQREGERNWYTTNPNALYPAAIEYIQDQLDKERYGDGVIRSQYYPTAAALPAKAWSLAMIPRDEVTETTEVELRAQALELARVWFTELLHRALRWKAAGVESEAIWGSEPPAAAQAPLGLRIKKDDAWRL